MPLRKGAVKQWKQRRVAAATRERHLRWAEYATDTTKPRPSDTMMRGTLSPCPDEAAEWLRTMHRDDSAERAPGQRVGDIIRVKLGSFEHTRVAISRRMGLRRSDLPDPMRQQVLQCPCGRGQQDAYHVWHECPHSERLMEDACSSIEGMWPEVLQLPGWGTLSTRARVKGLLTVTTWASTEAQRTLKAERRQLWRARCRGTIWICTWRIYGGHDNYNQL